MASIGPYKKRLISGGGTDPTDFARFIVSSREQPRTLLVFIYFPFSVPFFRDERRAAFPISTYFSRFVLFSIAECKFRERKKRSV